jgi:hypothetical protein
MADQTDNDDKKTESTPDDFQFPSLHEAEPSAPTPEPAPPRLAVSRRHPRKNEVRDREKNGKHI